MKDIYKPEDIISFLIDKSVNNIERDNVKSSAYRYAECLNNFHSYLAVDKPLRVLDLGTGKGWMALLIRHYYKQHSVTAVDVEVFDHVRKRLESERITVIDGCMFGSEELPLGNDSYDVILFFEALEHIIAEPRYIFREIFRFTAPGGKLLFTTPNLAFLFSRLLLLFGIQPQFYLTGLRHGKKMPRNHFREWTMKEIHMLMEDTGFLIKDQAYLYGHGGLGVAKKRIYLRIAYYVFRLFVMVKPTLREVLAVVGEKADK